MKRICLLVIAAICTIPAYSQGAGWQYSGETYWPGVIRDWNTATYDQFYLVDHYNDLISHFTDDSWTDFSSQWESGDYVFSKTCEYYTEVVPILGSDALYFHKSSYGIDAGVCVVNTLIGVRAPISDDFVIPSMPDINLFFVNLDFITKQKSHLNSLTIPNMIRGVYNSSGEKLYIDTLYVEGDYECMFNNKFFVYFDDRSRDKYDLEGKEPVLIAKTVIYEGEPIKSYNKRGKGVGLVCEDTYWDYLVANQWGDQIESVELTDRSLRGIASNAFNGCKTLKRVKITFPEWGGYFDYETRWGAPSYIKYPLIFIGPKAFYGCENLEVCDLGDDSITVYDKTGLDEPNILSFGDSLFAYCTKLDTFRCKNQHMVRDIGNYMFLGCGNLRYVGNWDDIETIGAGAFIGCDKLSVNIGSGNLKKIGASAFKGYTKLYNINSENLEEIGAYAFEGNTSISGHVSVPSAAVYSGAFRNCVNLESIDIGKTLFIDEIFKGCTSLEYVNVNKNEDSDYDLNRGIGKGCFEDCVNLKGISFNGSGYGKILRLEEMKRIDTCAFKNCRSLECDVVTCSGPYELSNDEEDEIRVLDSAFVGSGIKSVTLSYVNAANAFDDCANLESATFWGPDEGRNTFELPDFRNCPKLKKIVVNGGGWDLEAQVTLKDEQTVKVIDNLDGLYLLGKPHIYVGDYPNYNFANTILYVPKGMKNVYRENALAPTFKDIVELTDEQVGIIKVTIDGAAENGNGDAAVYDLSGQRVLKTVPGNVYVSKGRKFIAK